MPAAALLGYTALALLNALQLSVYRATQDQPIVWGDDLLAGLAQWYAWAALTPFVIWLVRRASATGRSWPAQLAVHVPAAAVFALAHLALVAALRRLFGLGAVGWLFTRQIFVDDLGWLEATLRYGAVLFKRLDSDMLIYVLLVGAWAALRYRDQVRARDLRAAQLEAQLTQAQLHVLRSQMHPHFLFNTLHAISTLMHRDVEAADRMLSRLSELLRLSLDSAARHEVSLAEELELLAPYVEIERTRFSDRLSIELDIDPAARPGMVPALMLQPLVENAIRHGIAPRRGPGRVQVRVERRGERLQVEVTDDGVGPPARFAEGIGLANLRERLTQLHGDAAEITAGGRDPVGFAVRLSLPFRGAEP